MNQQLSNSAASSFVASDDARRIAFIQANWHKDIVDQCRVGFLDEIERLGFSRDAIDLFVVPGSFEIPLQAKLLACSGRYAAIVAAGLIVDGGIYRHEFVADAVIGAMMRLQLDVETPIISAVLTPQRFHEHVDHRDFFLAHFRVKGAEAAQACMATIGNLTTVHALATSAAGGRNVARGDAGDDSRQAVSA